ncbi:hypothetical protein [Sphingomicrobium marinum]|uniref:hypothetical protein n=1 Tax=Sphingomicrobium marinum TaxID=1227950 RepID=UPI002240CB4A|nr:hypothetical protein [Sphingomicrobium marinum]
MKSLSGMVLAVMLALGASAAHAQQPTNTVEAIPPGGADLSPSVGPDDLRDFSLGGDQPAQQQPAPAPSTRPTATPPAARPAPTRPAPTQPSAPAPSQTQAPPPAVTAPPSAQGQVEPEVIDRADESTTLSPLPPISEAPIDAADQPTRTIRLPGDAAAEETPWWPWALGLAALLGGAFFLLRQRQQKAAFAGVPVEETPAAPSPEPAPAPTSKPALAPAAIADAKKPEFAIDFAPIRASLSENEFVIDYAMTLSNKGEAMARDVSIDVAIVMAGHEQEERIGKFVSHPPADRTIAVQALNSFGQAPLRGSVRLSGPDLTAINVDGRQLILPTLVFLPRHRDGKADPIRFVVGRKPQGSDKLAPMRGDLGPRVWRDLEARRA